MELSPEERIFIKTALINNYIETEDDIKNNVADKLIAKITRPSCPEEAFWVQTFEKLKEPINQELFLGNGVFSKLAANNLHKRLAFAISELNSIQQNGIMGAEFYQEDSDKSKENIINVIKDIIVAFDLDLTIKDFEYILFKNIMR